MAATDATVEIPVCAHADAAPPQGSFDNLVIVIVGYGRHKKEFQIHRGLLCHYSIYFQHILRDESNNDIELPYDEPRAFDTITYWMYTSRFWAPGTNQYGKIPLAVAQILQLFFFAAEKGMESLQNATLTLLYQKIVQEWKSPVSSASIIYSHTVPGSPLRRLLIDFVAETWGFGALETYRNIMPKDFPVDLLIRLRELKKAPGVGIHKAEWIERTNDQFCERFHVHGEPV